MVQNEVQGVVQGECGAGEYGAGEFGSVWSSILNKPDS